MNDLSFKEIWETLHNVDVSKHTEDICHGQELGCC